MQRLRTPSNIRSAIRCLTKARDMRKLTDDPADRAITDAQFAQLDDADPQSLLNFVLDAGNRLDASKARRALATVDATALRRNLVMHIIHFHRVLDLAIARDRMTPFARNHYGRDASNTALPPLGKQEQIIAAAEKIATGETTRQTADGPAFVPMTNPSPAEIAPILAGYKTALAALLTAKVETNDLQETIGNRRKELIALARDICETVRFHHRKDPVPASRREKNTRWGVLYVERAKKKERTDDGGQRAEHG